MNFKGRARRIDDLDLPRLGALIGVGEDELHAFMDVEAAGSGFDASGRPKMLFEPHRFYAELGAGAKRDEAVKQGLARKTWMVKGKVPKYPANSYSLLEKAILIDKEAALRAASWGLTQILGKWHKDIGYPSAEAMVLAFADDEAAHLEATIKLLVQWKVDDDLKAHRWDVVAKAWNGPAYASHGYHKKLKQAYERWAKIPDTKWPPKDWTPPEEPKPPELPVEPAKDAVVVTAPPIKKDETAVIITPKPDQKQPTTGVSKTGFAAIGAIILSIIAGVIRYFGG